MLDTLSKTKGKFLFWNVVLIQPPQNKDRLTQMCDLVIIQLIMPFQCPTINRQMMLVQHRWLAKSQCLHTFERQLTVTKVDHCIKYWCKQTCCLLLEGYKIYLCCTHNWGMFCSVSLSLVIINVSNALHFG